MTPPPANHEGRLPKVADVHLTEAQQCLILYLAGYPLSSARMLAFTDRADLEHAAAWAPPGENAPLRAIEETMRQRVNTVEGYLSEMDQLAGLFEAYHVAVRARAGMLEEAGSESVAEADGDEQIRRTFATELRTLKLLEIRRRGRGSAG